MADDNGWSCGPGCECSERLGRFRDVLDDKSMTFTAHEIQALEAIIYCCLCCVERHASDPIARMEAAAQLIDPWWDYQRSLEVEMER